MSRRRAFNTILAAGASVPFTPTSISGLQLWLSADTGVYQDAAGTTPATADGHAVQLWQDQSGNNYHVSQSTAGKIPVLKLTTNGINNRAAVSFDGGDLLVRTVANWLASDSLGTIVIVYKQTILSTLAGLFGTWDEATINFGLSVCASVDNSTNKFMSLFWKVDPTANNIKGNTTVVAGTTYIGLWQSTNTAYLMRINGANQTLTVTTGADNGNWLSDVSTQRDNISVGAWKRSSEANFFTGLISEILYYNVAITGADLTALEAYLNGRYSAF